MAKGRQLALQVKHTLRKAISFSAGGAAVVTIGTLPAGAAVIHGHIIVQTVFNAGTNNNLTVGIGGAATTFTPAVAMTSVGVKAFTGLSTSANAVVVADTDVIATLDLTGAAATTGQAIVVLEFVVNNDG